MVRYAIVVRIQRIGQWIVVPIHIRVFNRIQDTIVVIIKVRSIGNSVAIGIRTWTIGIQIIGSAVCVTVIVGRVTVQVDVLIGSINSVTVIVKVTVVHVLGTIGIGQVVRRVIDLVVDIEAIVYIRTFVTVIKTVTVGIHTCIGLVRNTVEVKIVAFVVVRY